MGQPANGATVRVGARDMAYRSAEDEDEEEELSSADEGDIGAGRGPRDAGGRADDDFDEFEDSAAQYSAGPSPGGGTQQVTNQPFDEAMDLSESDGGSENNSPTPRGSKSGAGGEGRGNATSRPRADAVTNQPFDEAMELSSEGSVDDHDEEDDDDDASPGPSPEPQPGARAQMGSSTGMGARAAMSAAPAPREEMPAQLEAMARRPEAAPAHRDDDDDFGNGGDESGGPIPEGLYDPAEYDNLQVSAEIKELFQHITRYKAHNIELETKMRPFIPDYIPAVGDIDPFVKVSPAHPATCAADELAAAVCILGAQPPRHSRCPRRPAASTGAAARCQDGQPRPRDA